MFEYDQLNVPSFKGAYKWLLVQFEREILILTLIQLPIQPSFPQ